MNSEQPAETQVKQRPPWLILSGLVLLSVAFIFLPGKDWIRDLFYYIAGKGTAGIAVYLALYVVFAVGLIPSTIMGLLAGGIYGLELGVPLAIVGSNLGALVSFLLSRSILRRRVEEWARANPKFMAFENAIAANGFKLVVLLRLSILVPYTLLNYLLGVTRVPLWKYAAGNFVGMLPGNFGFVYIGSLTLDIAMASRTPQARALQLVGLLATFVAIVVFTRMAQRALREAAPEAAPPASPQ